MNFMQILRASEDYLEAMLMMQKEHGYVRSIDIAEKLGVTKPSVTYATKRLRENGYITMDKDGLITLTEQVLSDDPLFFAINSYTEGLSPAVMEYVLKTTLCPKVGGHTSCDEIGLPVTATGGVVPCGATAVWEE